MNLVYLIIIWSVCLAYVGLNLYYKDFLESSDYSGNFLRMYIFINLHHESLGGVKVNKKWLATIGNKPLIRLRRMQLLLYLSLLVNIFFAMAFVAMMISGG